MVAKRVRIAIKKLKDNLLSISLLLYFSLRQRNKMVTEEKTP
jgi:hypothetical protein